MRIEPVTQENFSQAAHVYTVSWQESHKNVCSAAFLQQRDYEGYLKQRIDGLYVICDFVSVGVFRVKDGILSDLYIHPEFAGKGYGSACVEYAKKKSGQLRLTVLSSNERAIRFYEKRDFRFTHNDNLLRNGLWEREMIYTEKNQ